VSATQPSGENLFPCVEEKLINPTQIKADTALANGVDFVDGNNKFFEKNYHS
jgi:hypothetical protein